MACHEVLSVKNVNKKFVAMWKSPLLRVIRVDYSNQRFKSFAQPLRVLFYGSDHFSLATLEVLAEEV